MIAFRRQHPALGASGKIEFVYAEKNAYPLAYVREKDGEKILAVLNPAARAAEFRPACLAAEGSPAELLFALGGGGSVSGGLVSMQPCSAAFFRL